MVSLPDDGLGCPDCNSYDVVETNRDYGVWRCNDCGRSFTDDNIDDLPESGWAYNYCDDDDVEP